VVAIEGRRGRPGGAEVRVLDHLVVVTSDLSATRDWLSAETGVAGTYGGTNPVNGTHNVLYPLGAVAYLELLAADDDGRAAAQRPLPFGLATLAGVRVAGWAAQVPDLDEAVAAGTVAGAPLGPLAAMSRTRPDGVKLEWRMTYPVEGDLEALCPFLIDWGASEHPSVGLQANPGALSLTTFEIHVPEAITVRGWLDALGVSDDAAVVRDAVGGLRIAVSGPDGGVTILGSLPEGAAGA
jgi:catechol 2,3-dioxygenase-like lactoylglutathione lyase family enzyme